MKQIIKIFVVLGASLSLAACHKGVVVDKVDEAAYDNVLNTLVTVRDGQTNKLSNVVEIYKESITTEVAAFSARAPRMGVEVQLTYDPSYLEAYNAEHETSFEILPETQFSLQNGGKIVLSPDQRKSYPLDLTIGTFSDTEEKTYVLPFKVESLTKGVTVPESATHMVYLVKNRSGMPRVSDGDHKKIIIWPENRHTNPLNFLLLETEDGRLVTDYVVIFKYQLGYDPEKEELLVRADVPGQFILDNYDKVVKPLRDRGIKVAVSILGGDPVAGPAQLSDEGCRDFARRVAAFVNKYGFDGVNYDDEYSGAPDLSNPLFAPRSYTQGDRLFFETKRLLPDKDMICYQYGQTQGRNPVDGVDPSEYMDIFNADYGSAARPYGHYETEAEGLAKCSFMSNDFESNRGPMPSTSSVQQFVESDYGWWMIFAFWATPGSKVHYDRLNTLVQGTLGSPLKKPTYFYTDCASFTTSPITW